MRSWKRVAVERRHHAGRNGTRRRRIRRCSGRQVGKARARDRASARRAWACSARSGVQHAADRAAPDRRGGRSRRGWNVWFANGSMTPARVTAMIQGAAQWCATSVISTASRAARPAQQVAEPDADQRGELRARDRRRRYRWRGIPPASPRSAAFSRICSIFEPQGLGRLDRVDRGVGIGRVRPLRASRLERSRRSAPSARASDGIELAASCAVRERRRDVAGFALDGGQLTVAGTRCRAKRQSPLVGPRAPRRSVRARPPCARRRRRPADVSEFQHVDAARAASVSAGIGRQRRLRTPRAPRRCVLREQRVALARRAPARSAAVWRQRAVEMRDRRAPASLRASAT